MKVAYQDIKDRKAVMRDGILSKKPKDFNFFQLNSISLGMSLYKPNKNKNLVVGAGFDPTTFGL